jgi:DoxX-like family
MTILGVWYVLAGVAILAPRFPRLKEWAYAGLIFNYTGAAASHLAAGDSIGALVAPIIPECAGQLRGFDFCSRTELVGGDGQLA